MFFKDFVSVKRQKIKRGASQTYNTPSEVSVCPSCGTTNICYTHVMNDVASGLKFLTKILKK